MIGDFASVLDYGWVWLLGLAVTVAWIVWHQAGAELDLEDGE